MDVSRIAVVGAGVMGSGIAQSLAVAGYDVTAYDLTEPALAAFRTRIEDGRFGVRKGVEIGKLDATAAEAALARVHTTTDLGGAVESADVVVEAIYEDFEVKTRTFRTLDERAPQHAILASNTSGLSISALAGSTRRPEKVIGWHWASPASIMRLAEIATTPSTSQDTVDTIVEIATKAGKHPQVVKDHAMHWGFVTNRILMAAVYEAQQIVSDEVATEDQVDALVKDCFRWPVGLFEMLRSTGQNWDPGEQRVATSGHTAFGKLL
jgi:3-hydroxybutyryl-CoA dehydrogenase